MSTPIYQLFLPRPYAPDLEPWQIQMRVEHLLSRLETLLPKAEAESANRSSLLKQLIVAWRSLNLEPETADSFQGELADPYLFNSFMRATWRIADLAVREGRMDEAVIILKRLTREKIGESWYRFDPQSKFKRSSAPHCSLLGTIRGVSARLFEELGNFLKHEVTRPAIPADLATALKDRRLIDRTCFHEPEPPLISLDFPKSIRVREGEPMVVPLRVTSGLPNLPTGPLEIRWSIGGPPDLLESVGLESGGNYLSSASYFSMDFPGNTSVYRGDTYYRMIHRSRVPAGVANLNLRVSWNRVMIDHDQPEFPLWVEVTPLAAPELKMLRVITVRVDNANEAPTANILGAGHVKEGEEICLDPSLADPEHDPVTPKWGLKAGNAAIRLDPGGRICLTPPITHRFERPLDVELTATDRINTKQHPGLKPATGTAVARVFVDPTVPLPTGEMVEPPKDVVEIMSNPDQPGMETAPMARGAFLYVFLRLPRPFDSFGAVRVNSDIASLLTFESETGSLYGFARERVWSPFQAAPVGPATFVAYSRSPIRRWTNGGTYKFDDNDKSSTVEVQDRWADLTVGIKGEVTIDPPEARVRLGMKVEPSWDRDWLFRLSFDNVRDPDGTPFFKVPGELPFEISVTNETTAGTARLSRSVKGRRLPSPDPNRLLYEIPVAVPERYAANAAVKVGFRMANRYGEEAKFYYEVPTLPPSAGKTVFDGFQFKIDSDPIPLPWYLLRLQTPPDLAAPILGSGLSTRFSICPPEDARRFIQDCSTLEYFNRWGRTTAEGEISLPLRLSQNMEKKLATAYRAIGGTVTGTIFFKLQERPTGSPDATSEPWAATLELPKASMVVPPDYSIPIDWNKVLLFPLYVVLAFTEMAKAFIESLTAKPMISTDRKSVKPGDEFSVELSLPLEKELGEKKHKVEFKGLTAGGIAEAVKTISLVVKPKGGARSDLYTLRPHASEEVEKGRYRLTFTFPSYMPQGNYEGELSTASNFYADYLFHYDSDGSGEPQYEKVMPVSVWRREQRFPLNRLTFIGDPKILPPAARGVRGK